MVKYEKEEATFKRLKEHYEKESANSFLWSQIFFGWETEELRRLFEESAKTTLAILSELDKLLDMIKKRRDMNELFD